MRRQNNESGIIILGLLFFLAILAVGYVIINSISKSRQAAQVEEAASNVIETTGEALESAADEVIEAIE